jgi:hypothetical protein
MGRRKGDRMTEQDAIKRYGPIVNGKFLNESQWMILMPVDAFIFRWRNSATNLRPSHIYCNKDFAPLLMTAFLSITRRGLNDEIETFDGCFGPRMIRGSLTEWSAHSWGIALDLNAKLNPLGGPIHFTPEFRKCFSDAGLTCGADFKRVDGMHFSMGF